ncbi:MAG: glycoside hydrolase family 43 protein [Candidatus Cyclobacteriaceae bacterium M3_2C_046]
MKRSYLSFIILFIFFSCHTKSNTNGSWHEKELIKTSEIRVRDPFILADEQSKTYYLYASISNRADDEGPGVEVYTSKDLQNWTKPQVVFQVPPDLWATKWVWAPEVHSYKDKYYLFTTFTSYDTLKHSPADVSEKDWPPFHRRGTQILVSVAPTGPFEPFSNNPHINIDWMTLDGTFWTEDNQPYLIYCHEWVQVKDGTINLIGLKDDLSAVTGQNRVLFKASDAQWTRPIRQETGYVTDGCFLYRSKTDKLLMIWSSFGEDGYAIGTAFSESGSIKGPWRHNSERLFIKDGGHGMIFRTFDDQLVLTLHQPNTSPDERMQLYRLKDTEENLELAGRLF